MTELQVLRNDLLKEWGNIKDAQAAYEFVMTYGEQNTSAIKDQAQTDDMPDGIYIVTIYGAIPFDTDRPKPDHDNIKGIGIKYGSRSLVVALYDDADDADNKEITLTAKADKTNADKFYRDDYLDAVADWSGKKNTEHLKTIGLNPAIKLNDEWYIPSLGEMYFIFTNLKAVNEALEFIGADPIKQEWYWTSTEDSATGAWSLGLNDGYAYGNAKATLKLRVRAVSAFIS